MSMTTMMMIMMMMMMKRKEKKDKRDQEKEQCNEREVNVSVRVSEEAVGAIGSDSHLGDSTLVDIWAG